MSEKPSDALRAALDEIMEQVWACVVKTRDDIDSHEWDAYMNKAAAYDDCVRRLKARLAAAEAKEEQDG